MNKTESFFLLFVLVVAGLGVYLASEHPSELGKRISEGIECYKSGECDE